MPRRSFATYTAVIPAKRTVPSYHLPNVTAKESEVQPKDGEQGRKAYYLPFAFTWGKRLLAKAVCPFRMCIYYVVFGGR